MRKFFKEVILRQRTSHNVVRKTDDEVTRYVKQKRIMRRRNDFDERMQLDTLAREARINTREIRVEHYSALQNLELDHYDKGYVNDNVLEYDFLHKKGHYRPLGQRLRPFFQRPLYARRQDWEYQAGWLRYLFRTAAGVTLIYAGYRVGKWDSKDELLAASTVVEFEEEDQIYDFLFNQKKMGVFIYLYSPGTKLYDDFNNVLDRESSKYQLAHRKRLDPECEEDAEDDVVFMRVNCRRHLNFCINKIWSGRITPAAEVYSLSEEGQVEVVDFNNWHRSAQGIEGFLTSNGLVDDRFNPEELLERGGRKFIKII